MFDRPDQAEPIVFFPVGSVCIVDWVQAMPDSPRKLTFLKELESELEKADAVRAESRVPPSEEKKIQAKLKRQEQSKKIKERNEERKRAVAARKEAKKKDREARKQESQGEPPKPEVEDDDVDDGETQENLNKKFKATQDEFGWD